MSKRRTRKRTRRKRRMRRKKKKSEKKITMLLLVEVMTLRVIYSKAFFPFFHLFSRLPQIHQKTT